MPTIRSAAEAEVRYRRKKVSSNRSILAILDALRTKRPDIYGEQVRKLGGSHEPDIEPCKLSLPDQGTMVAYALEYFLEDNDAPLSPLAMLNAELELPQTSQIAQSSQPLIQHDTFLAQPTRFNPQRSQASHSAQSPLPLIHNERFLAQSPPFNLQESQMSRSVQGSSQPLLQNDRFFMQDRYLESQALMKPLFRPTDPTSRVAYYPAIDPYTFPNINGFEGFPMTQFVTVPQSGGANFANRQDQFPLAQPNNEEGWFNSPQTGEGGSLLNEQVK